MNNNINHVFKKIYFIGSELFLTFNREKIKSVTNKTTKEVKPNYKLFKTVLETNILLNVQDVLSNFHTILTDTVYIKMDKTSWAHSS